MDSKIGLESLPKWDYRNDVKIMTPYGEIATHAPTADIPYQEECEDRCDAKYLDFHCNKCHNLDRLFLSS